ncbi:CDP-diacylglycerol--glycerol-3-phosphate 3-phosphatidyltransferase [uncultured Faecalibaculum sp.]|uniref:CDP-diacylglycerol--glycerol-3-phosphate 3-phosphatidyltransferase n=1 Tax=uncultured Faecalibaculum sp. TaxID=1729681 RepID=UPI0025EA5F80|nr:CDP-diacylglycerol--glycerol-3-phosphate 3-phosphatidyltransferase [uncultured Faecalibaculum sp.]
MNLPNKLTLVRILLVPAAAIIYLAVPASWAPVVPSIGLAGRDLIVFAIFAVASFTDYLDGTIARSRNLITSFGKFADPIADKLLVNTLLILLAWSHQASVVAVLLMTARDLIVDGLRMSAAQSGEVVSAGWWGKVKTVLQMFAIALLLLHDWPFALLGIPAGKILLWAACAASLYSGWIYFEKLKKYVLETM